MQIRRATLADASQIAQVHVATWRTTYRGIMPQELLDSLDTAQRTQGWERTLSNARAEECVLVLDQDATIVGFVYAGPERTQQPIYTGEIYAIYLLAEQQGRGWGGQLLQRGLDFLKPDHAGAMLWVVEGNPAEGFYAAQGGQRLSSKVITRGGKTLNEFSYGWDWRQA